MTKDWKITYQDTPTGVKSYGQESLLTLGNGYFGWRGAPITSRYNDDHYPGLYVAGIFNQTTTRVDTHDVVNEDLVNFPNPQLLELTINGRKLATSYNKRIATLDMKQGLLKEELVYPVAEGKLYLTTTKLCNPIAYHQLGLRVEIRTDFDAKIALDFMIDGAIQNQNVARYREFNSQEYTVTKTSQHILCAKTLQSKIDFAVGATTTSAQGKFQTSYSDKTISDQAEFDLKANEMVQVDRVISVATSNELTDYQSQVQQDISEATFEKIYQTSFQHWQAFWQKADVKLSVNEKDIQELIRLSIFQLHQAAQAKANPDLDASIGSRGLTGEGYRGHIFWDELFVLPYYSELEPDTAKALLKYRIKRLGAARQNAQSQSEKGAMYPWQSASIGDEQAQFIHMNPMTNAWYPDNSRLQRHVSLAVVYDLWSYVQATGDLDILKQGGLQVLLQTSKFWLNKVQYDGNDYHLSGVMGPDEFHEAYPETKAAGLSDNAYTNLMLAWSLNWLLELQTELKDDFKRICQESDFDDALLQKANEVAHHLAIYRNQDGVIEQYNHYFELKELDLPAYQQKYGDIHRIDRILTAEHKSPDDYQVDKQADTLMMIYNLGPKIMESVLKGLGKTVQKDWLVNNRDYYLARTVHGSTVSRPVYASVDLALNQREEAWKKLKTALRSDYDDIQGGTTAEGIHIGVMGAALTIIMRDFAGVRFEKGHVTVDPKLPKCWQSLAFHKQYRGINYHFEYLSDQVKITADHNCQLKFEQQTVDLLADHTKVFELK